MHFYQIQKRLYAGISIFIPKEKYTSKLYNILNLVWHNYNTTFFIIYQDTFKKIAKYTKKENRHDCDGKNQLSDFSGFCFAVLMEEISILRITPQLCKSEETSDNISAFCMISSQYSVS